LAVAFTAENPFETPQRLLRSQSTPSLSWREADLPNQGYDIAETDGKGDDLAVHRRRGLRHMRHEAKSAELAGVR